jgi:peptidyl-prolyl cis-trans isomerase SurA
MLNRKEFPMMKRFALGLAAALFLGAPLAADVVEQVLVRINGDILTKTEFEQRQVAVLRGRPELANVTPDSAELKKAIEEVTPQLVLDAVDELLLVQRGRELGYTMNNDQFNSVLGEIKKQNNLEDDAKFQAALKSEGMTLADLRKSLEQRMLISRVMQTEVGGKVSINDEEAKAYYDSHKQEFSTPSTLTLREILIEVPTSDRGVNAAQDEAAKEKALSVRNRLLGGEPFPRLAAEVSDSGSKANGGLIGPISHSELAPSLQKLLDSMKIGDISEPIRTPRGYQLLKLEERSEVKVKSFEEARNEIGDKIGEEKMSVEREKYLDKLRAEATIVWRNDELKKAYEQALASRKSPAAGTQSTAR